MKTKRLAKLPKCDFCGKPAKYDAPTTSGGRWGNMCEECFGQHASGHAQVVGTEFVEGIAERQSGKPKLAKTVNLESAICDERYVECPDCGEERHVEPDANYKFNCEGCGIPLKCLDIMCEL